MTTKTKVPEKKVGVAVPAATARRESERRKPRYRNNPRRARKKLHARLGVKLLQLQQRLSSAEQDAGWWQIAVSLERYYQEVMA